jgi:tetratricopeptide (TPR) repeat protein
MNTLIATDAEQRLIEAARDGLPADLRSANTDNDPANGAEWGPERTIRAEVIHALATGARDDWPVHSKGIQLFGTRKLITCAYQEIIYHEPLQKACRPSAKRGAMEKSDVDEEIELGVEALHKGNIDDARTIFLRILRKDHENPDGHHHLGLIAMSYGDLGEAERRFRSAIQACDARSTNDDIAGGFIMRAKARSLHSLALVMRSLERRSEAILLLEELLRIDERDGLGGRYILAEEYHRQGKISRAVRMYRDQMEDPGSRFLLALALIQRKAAPAEIGRALLRAFERNRYFAPILLGDRCPELDGHLDNRESLKWATDCVASTLDLWKKTDWALPTMKQWWSHARVVEWRNMLDRITRMYVNVKELETRAAQHDGRAIMIPKESIEIRGTFGELRDILVSDEFLGLVVRAVLGIV